MGHGSISCVNVDTRSIYEVSMVVANSCSMAAMPFSTCHHQRPPDCRFLKSAPVVKASTFSDSTPVYSLPGASGTGNRMGLQAQPQRFDHLQNRCKAGVALARKGFVKALPTQAGVLCQLRHALGSGNHSPITPHVGNGRFSFWREFTLRALPTKPDTSNMYCLSLP